MKWLTLAVFRRPEPYLTHSGDVSETVTGCHCASISFQMELVLPHLPLKWYDVSSGRLPVLSHIPLQDLS